MSDDFKNGRYKLVGYRIGESLCLSPSQSISAVMKVPTNLVQVPGTKPWILGASKLHNELIPFINIARFLNIQSRGDVLNQPILVVRGPKGVGNVGLLVDELIGIYPTGTMEDVPQSDLRIPPGLGSSLAGVVSGSGKVWALIDLLQLVSDEKLQKIDLN